MNIEKFTVRETQSVLAALGLLCEKKGTDPLVLFVMNGEQQIVGTLTDGDVRRSLVAGATLESPVSEVAHRNFKYLKEDEADIELLHECKRLGVELLPVVDADMHIVDIVNFKQQKSLLPLDAVLMAGGKGVRLRPLTEKTPKPLLPVGGKPIIDYNVDNLISYGVKHINVTVNYLAEQIESHFSEPYDSVQVRCFREPKFFGTIGSIRYVDTFYNDTILVMNSDVFTNLDFEDFYLHFKQHNADMSVCAIPYSIKVPYGIFRIEGDRDINGVIEKPTYNYYANAGIYLIKRELLDLIPADTIFHSTDLLSAAVESGKKVTRFTFNGTWIDIGNSQEYQRAKELVKHLK